MSYCRENVNHFLMQKGERGEVNEARKILSNETSGRSGSLLFSIFFPISLRIKLQTLIFRALFVKRTHRTIISSVHDTITNKQIEISMTYSCFCQFCVMNFDFCLWLRIFSLRMYIKWMFHQSIDCFWFMPEINNILFSGCDVPQHLLNCIRSVMLLALNFVFNECFVNF